MSTLSMKLESILLPIVYESQNLQQLINISSEFLNAPVRFSPENNPNLAIVSPSYPKQDLEDLKAVHCSIENHLDSYMYSLSQDNGSHAHFCPKTPNVSYARILCPVIIGQRYFGNLTIPEYQISLKQIDMDCVDLLSRMVALSCSVSGRYGYSLNPSDLLELLLSGKVTQPEQLASYSAKWRSLDGTRFRLIFGSLPKNTRHAIYASGFQRIFPGSLYAWHENVFNVLVDITDRDLSTAQLDNLRQFAAAINSTICISMPFSDILSVSDIWRCSLEHPQMRSPSPEGKVIFYEENPEYSLFYHTTLSFDKLSQLCDQRLKRVEEFDREHDGEYMKTIRAYIACNGSAADTAVMLCTHKNTVLYRIRRIEEMFGIDLTNYQELFRVMLAEKLAGYAG